MKPLSHPRSLTLSLSLLLGSLAISGCGGVVSFPDAVSSSQVDGPPVTISVYGGHAPIVGTHVYLLEPGTTGYGSAPKSLLGNNGATSANGYAITADVNDPYVTVGAKYVTTDSTGSVSLTGAYKCDVGSPVYSYGYGGTLTSSTATKTEPVATITKIVVSNSNVINETATYALTLNTTANQLPVGSTTTISGLTGELAAINGTQTATASTGNTITFTATNVYGYFIGLPEPIVNGTYNETGGGNPFGTAGTVSTSETATNPTTQLAILGICPSSGNFSTAGNGALTYVYSNEVSTVAAAYVFQPFTLASNDNAWDIGTSGTTEALLGISNAAQTAAQLYSIQGNAQQSTTLDGEGHIANYQTVSTTVQGTTIVNTPNQGNGIVPQATIDSLANILAACIDATPGTGGTLSTQCATLFNTATANGSTVVSGDSPATDTATAAINIARYPAGNSSGTPDATYVTDLFNLQTGVVPYTPDLGKAPHDWTLAITYQNTAPTSYTNNTGNGTLGSVESVAIDDIGQIWLTAQTKDDIVRWSPLGVQNASNTLTYIPGYVSIDGSNNAWTGNAISTSGILEANSNGVLDTTYGSGYNSAYVMITNNAGDAFFFASNGNTGGNYEMFEYGPNGATITGSPFSISPSVITAGDNIGHGAIDASGDLWITSESSDQIARVTPTGTKVFTPIVTAQQPEFPAIDHSGNAWIAVQETASQIYVVSPTGTDTVLTSASTGAELTSTFGAAVDGNGNVWFANRCGNYGNCGSTAGENSIVEINGATQQAISPATNYVPENQFLGSTAPTSILNGPLNLAIDPSGNIWITNYTGSTVTEMVGAAAPVVTPLSYAAGNNELGVKP